MATKKMWFEGKIYSGTAGSTATNELTNSREIMVEKDGDIGDTTVRGDGSVVPMETGRPTTRRLGLTWTMLKKSDDTNLATLTAAAYADTAVAIRTVDYSTGKGFDGDVYLNVKEGRPYKGEQTVEFSVSCVTDENRDPQYWV